MESEVQAKRRYDGLVRIVGSDGITWDVVSASLEEGETTSRPFVGSLRKPEEAAVAWWMGPVYLEAVNRPGRVKAFLQPASQEGAAVVVRVSGVEPIPWDDWLAP